MRIGWALEQLCDFRLVADALTLGLALSLRRLKKLKEEFLQGLVQSSTE